MNRTQTVDAISEMLDLSKKDVGKVLDAYDTVATNTLKKGVAFTLGKIGKLDPVTRAARLGRNPATMQEVQIPEKRTAKFKPSKDLLGQLA